MRQFKSYVVALIVLVAAACDDGYEQPADAPADSTAPVAVDSAPDRGSPEERSRKGADPDSFDLRVQVDVVPADEAEPACEATLEVSETRAGFTVQAHDCPNANEEWREDARAKFAWGGARAGYGTGQVGISVRKIGALPADVGRFCSPGLHLSIGNTIEAPHSSAARTDEQGPCLATYITGPFDSPIDLTVPVRVIRAEAEYPAFVTISFRPADGSERHLVYLYHDE